MRGSGSLADKEPDAPGGKPSAPPPVPDIRLALKKPANWRGGIRNVTDIR